MENKMYKLSENQIKKLEELTDYMLDTNEEMRHYFEQSEQDNHIILDIFEVFKGNKRLLDGFKTHFERYYDETSDTVSERLLKQAIDEEISLAK